MITAFREVSILLTSLLISLVASTVKGSLGIGFPTTALSLVQIIIEPRAWRRAAGHFDLRDERRTISEGKRLRFRLGAVIRQHLSDKIFRAAILSLILALRTRLIATKMV